MELPLISVIVPIYNVENYLERCVESIIHQTYKNLEIILVDDGSPDNCPQMCDEWAKKDNRIKVIHKENGGLSDARNAGTMIASGELVAYIDSDDWIESKMFEDMYNRMQKDGSDIVASGVNWVEEDGSLIRVESSEIDCVLDRTESMTELLGDRKFKQHVWNKLYKFKLIKNIPFEKGKYHEDVFWSYQVVGSADRVSVMTKSYYNYVQRSNSIMGESYSIKRLDALDAMKQRCEYMSDHFPELYDKALNVYIGSCMYHIQLAINASADKSIVKNIKDRVTYHKNGDVFENMSGKQKMWLKMFVNMPMLTCRLRNILKIGL